MKAIVIVGDGMADQPLEELNNMTPIEAAGVKNMDHLASNGISGLLYSTLPGAVPESDTANLALFGYNPYEVYTGRGGFEAVGAGIQLKETDVAFRCDFATVNEGFIVVNERAGRIREEAAELARALHDINLKTLPEIEVIFRQTLGFKGVLILRGERLSTNVITHPPRLGCRADLIKPLDDSAETERTCEALKEIMKASYSLLKDHPINMRRRSAGKPAANVIIPWGVGRLPRLQPFHEKYKLRAACVAAASLIKGMARLAGMTVVDVPGATGEIDTDTMAKAKAALEALKSSDVVFVHVGGPDEASHDGDVYGKISIIKKIDAMIGLILEHINLEETCVALLADHVTSTKLRRHVSDPAPITIAGANIANDGVYRYSEKAAAKGGLRRIQHKDLMPTILRLMGY
ncbi:MAG: 2,3-bisphosphoglycerate-independent phosphoglycerate mutase [Nitrososphaerota archaeon]|nr:2,3-bisphosphoglycerate-independent phosphoglycerate mutase [Nitrososphaerota archaeon]